VKAQDPIPDGYPPVVLQALKGSIIFARANPFKNHTKWDLPGWWSNQRCFQLALDLVKKRLDVKESTINLSRAITSSQVKGSDQDEREESLPPPFFPNLPSHHQFHLQIHRVL